MNRKILLDNDIAKIKLDFYGFGAPVLHFDLHKKLTPGLYKWIIQCKEDLLVTIGLFGFDTIYSIIPKDKKILKFNKKMGFEIEKETDYCYILSQDI